MSQLSKQPLTAEQTDRDCSRPRQARQPPRMSLLRGPQSKNVKIFLSFEVIFISKLALDCYDWKTKICASTYGNGKGKLSKIWTLPRAPLRLDPALVWAQFRQGLMSSPFESWTNNQHLLSSLAQPLLGFDVVALLTAEVTPDHQSDWRKKRFNFFDQIISINSKKNMTWNSEFNHASHLCKLTRSRVDDQATQKDSVFAEHLLFPLFL